MCACEYEQEHVGDKARTLMVRLNMNMHVCMHMQMSMHASVCRNRLLSTAQHVDLPEALTYNSLLMIARLSLGHVGTCTSICASSSAKIL